jgi:hypothetical protein
MGTRPDHSHCESEHPISGAWHSGGSKSRTAGGHDNIRCVVCLDRYPSRAAIGTQADCASRPCSAGIDASKLLLAKFMHLRG